MGRLKGSGPAVELSEAEFSTLVTGIKHFGNNVVARKAGLSKNYISMIIKGKSGISINTLERLNTAIGQLKKIKGGKRSTDSAVVRKSGLVACEA